jgi:hypothetical protein
MKCPKCGYLRKLKDDVFVHTAECPSCGVIYAKLGPAINASADTAIAIKNYEPECSNPVSRSFSGQFQSWLSIRVPKSKYSNRIFFLLVIICLIVLIIASIGIQGLLSMPLVPFILFVSFLYWLMVVRPKRKISSVQLSPVGTHNGTDKRILPAFILCFMFGSLGAHLFYVGRVGKAMFYLVTFGGYIILMIDFLLFDSGPGELFLPLLILAAVVAICVLVDFIQIIIGSFTDNNGIKITKWT